MLQKIKDLPKELKIVAGVIVLVLFIWNGYGEYETYIERCSVEASRHWEANFSETTIGLDFEGEIDYDTETWSETASDRYYVSTVNRDLVSSYPKDKTFMTQSGFYYIKMPNKDYSFRSQAHFSRYSDMSRIVAKVQLYDETVTIDFKSYEKHLKMMEKRQPIIVNTWYGMGYSTNAED